MIFVIDHLMGTILGYFYFKQESGAQYRTTYSIEKTTADLLIFGSSRANHHYHPAVFKERFNLSYYNVGRDGHFIFYNSAVLKAVLERYVPNIIILDLIGGEFGKNQVDYDRLSSLLPYYKSHPEMRSIIKLKSKFEYFKMLSSIYPYNSSMFTISIGNTEFNKKRRGDIQGFIPLTNVWSGPIQIDDRPAKYELDSIKINAFETFIQQCNRSKIKLYIICSPYYFQSRQTEYSVKIGREIAKRYDISFFDYSEDSIFIQNSKLFSDTEHLNETGARVFSNILIGDIEKMTGVDDTESLTSLPNSPTPSWATEIH